MPLAMPFNFVSETIWTADNIDVMRGINDECIDLVYLDPPFNSNKIYEAPIGSMAAGASFKDAWTLDDADVFEHGELADRNPAAGFVIETARHTHGKSMQAYLIFMAVRLLEIHRILKQTGSMYLHCDPTAGHYLKLLLDGIFGVKGYRNEIVWCYTGPGSPKMKQFNRKHDTIFWYTKGSSWTFNKDLVRLPYKDPKQRPRKAFDTGNAFEPCKIEEMRKRGKIPETWWADIALAVRSPKERTGYPTQKPLKLLRRIIEASSNIGDMILDPFCGCATTLVAADQLQRKWAGIDLSPIAIEKVNERIANDRGPMWKGAIALTSSPTRTDHENLPDYRTHRHRLYGEQEGVCVGCLTHFPFRVMEVDHVLPKSKGGTDHIDNLQLLCSGCNRSKGSRTMAQWRAAKSKP